MRRSSSKIDWKMSAVAAEMVGFVGVVGTMGEDTEGGEEGMGDVGKGVAAGVEVAVEDEEGVGVEEGEGEVTCSLKTV
jgi:hypothetical protein